nr:putative capsid precursor [buhirugu virus 7]
MMPPSFIMTKKNRKNQNQRTQRVVVKRTTQNNPAAKQMVETITTLRRKRYRRRNQAIDSRAQLTASGRDLLEVISIAPDAQAGTAVMRQPFHLSSLAGTRLQSLGKLYGRWRPNRLLLRINSAASAMTNGAVLIGWSPTPAPTEGEGITLRWLSALPHMRNLPLKSGNLTLSLPTQTKQRWLMNTRDPTEENTHGYLYAMVLAPPNATSAVAVSIQLEWVITFSEPQQEDNGFDLGTAIRPTSDAQVYVARIQVAKDGTVNGVLCWSNHQPVTYTGLTTADTRNIYLFPAGLTTSEEETKAYYGVLSKSSYLNALLMIMFPTFSEAKKYQETYSVYNGWPVKADGPWNSSTPCYLVSAWTPTMRLNENLGAVRETSNFRLRSQSSLLTVGENINKLSRTSSNESLVLVSQQPRRQLEEH